MKVDGAAMTRVRAVRMLAASASFAMFAAALPTESLALTPPTQLAQASQPEAPAQMPAPATPAPETATPPAQAPQSESEGASSTKPIATPEQIRASGNVEIIRDLSKLPAPVAKMRDAIMAAAASGDIEKLRPLIGFDPALMQVGSEGDAIEAIKSLSGDPDGLEIMAIMMDLLQPGAAHINIGKPDEMYVWPYFVGKPLDSLTAAEKVELLRIITAGDLIAMEENNNYSFYRIGITPNGQWKLFAGGD